VYGTGIMIVGLLAVLAGYIPARRASTPPALCAPTRTRASMRLYFSLLPSGRWYLGCGRFFSVLSDVVAQRTAEIGIRTALGVVEKPC
jgi:hypothetical protein